MEETSFSLALSSLYLYTDGLSERLAKMQKRTDKLQNRQSLVECFINVPERQGLKLFASEASMCNAGFDAPAFLLNEDINRKAGD